MTMTHLHKTYYYLPIGRNLHIEILITWYSFYQQSNNNEQKKLRIQLQSTLRLNCTRNEGGFTYNTILTATIDENSFEPYYSIFGH